MIPGVFLVRTVADFRAAGPVSFFVVQVRVRPVGGRLVVRRVDVSATRSNRTRSLRPREVRRDRRASVDRVGHNRNC